MLTLASAQGDRREVMRDPSPLGTNFAPPDGLFGQLNRPSLIGRDLVPDHPRSRRVGVRGRAVHPAVALCGGGVEVVGTDDDLECSQTAHKRGQLTRLHRRPARAAVSALCREQDVSSKRRNPKPKWAKSKSRTATSSNLLGRCANPLREPSPRSLSLWVFDRRERLSDERAAEVSVFWTEDGASIS